jgi:hypothetical protein
MDPTQNTLIEPGNRIQLPADWVKALGLHGQVALDKTPDGILVRPCRRLTWEEFFATGLTINSAPPDQNEDDIEVTGDDYVF